MPIYEYECKDCNEIHSHYRNVEEWDLRSDCPKCRKEVDRIISKLSNAEVSGYPYFDKCLDREITSSSHRKSVLKSENLIEAG